MGPNYKGHNSWLKFCIVKAISARENSWKYFILKKRKENSISLKSDLSKLCSWYDIMIDYTFKSLKFP